MPPKFNPYACIPLPPQKHHHHILFFLWKPRDACYISETLTIAQMFRHAQLSECMVSVWYREMKANDQSVVVDTSWLLSMANLLFLSLMAFYCGACDKIRNHTVCLIWQQVTFWKLHHNDVFWQNLGWQNFWEPTVAINFISVSFRRFVCPRS